MENLKDRAVAYYQAETNASAYEGNDYDHQRTDKRRAEKALVEASDALGLAAFEYVLSCLERFVPSSDKLDQALSTVRGTISRSIP